MQRWILLGVVSLLFLVSAAVGGYWWLTQNRDDQQWVPMPFHPSSRVEDRAKLQREIEEYLIREDVIKKIVADLSLSERYGVSNEQQAIDRLKLSMFVRLGEVRHPLTQEMMPSLDIGVKGKWKENRLLGEIAMGLAKTAHKHLGIDQGS